MNNRISTAPRTAMELAFNRAVQKHATSKKKPTTQPSKDARRDAAPKTP